MGMSIDEIIKGIQIIKAQAEWDYPLDWQIVLDGAIDIMRKYQKLEQEPTTKNDLGVDCISRAEVLRLMKDNWHTHNGDWAMQESMDDIRALPSVTPQNQVHPLCEDCHTKMDEVRRAYDNAMKQEPILDKIRAEIEELPIAFTSSFEMKQDCLDILDKYKAESEDEE